MGDDHGMGTGPAGLAGAAGFGAEGAAAGAAGGFGAAASGGVAAFSAAEAAGLSVVAGTAGFSDEAALAGAGGIDCPVVGLGASGDGGPCDLLSSAILIVLSERYLVEVVLCLGQV